VIALLFIDDFIKRATMHQPSVKHSLGRLAMCAILACSVSLQAQAQVADIASQPLGKSSSTAVQANLMFIMDDSGSMGWNFLPDQGNFAGYCFGYSGVNRIFFDPNTTYLPPLQADGTSFPNAVFDNVMNDGFKPSQGSTNLIQTYNLSTPSVKVLDAPNTYKNYYFSRPKDPSLPVNCAPNITPDMTAEQQAAAWDAVLASWDVVTFMPAAKRQDYANWHAYYRTRINVMKSSVGRAMSSIDGTRFRVGYSAISSGTLSTSDAFLPLGEFVNDQRLGFYSRLYGETPKNGTPLRPALEKIGRYYAGKTLAGGSLPAGVADPIQYSCQRNYVMLTTDGNWNTSHENIVSSGYAPRTLTGADLGNPDGGASVARPMRDDGQTLGSNWVPGGAGVGNTLADIAQYFYITDLRQGTPGSPGCIGSVAGQDVCEDVVQPSGEDDARHQHMVTYSLGLGIAGTLNYTPDYTTAPTGSFAEIKSGARAWPNPFSVIDGARADDLWHAAVNGRGRFYSAASPNQLVNGLTDALESIDKKSGVAAASATSSLQPVDGDNFQYVGEYTTVLWEGNVKAYELRVEANNVVTRRLKWQAADKLKLQVSDFNDGRRILFRNPATNLLTNFTALNLATHGYDAHFSNMCSGVGNKLSQCATLTEAQVANANNTANVVNYIRGRTGAENSAGNTNADMRVFRSRQSTPLGDIVNASPVYVKSPKFSYSDAGYADFKAANTESAGPTARPGRRAMLYAAANDGMLHAFDANTGVEQWAFVPTKAMPLMHIRADENYANKHTYMVDGSPVVGDVFNSATGTWHTVLVGGMGAGGRGYYALDITNPDPSQVKVLWELSEADLPTLGLTYGNPVITKNKSGEWIVAFTSGYNNHTGTGDGNGHVYVRDALTGAQKGSYNKISTFVSSNNPAGTRTNPSNLGKLAAWVEDETNNTAVRMYSGDMQGNVWRIDFDDTVAQTTGAVATRMAQTIGPAPGNAAQPITTVPILSALGASKFPVVTVATGRYLGSSDVADEKVQSIYVFKDRLDGVNLGNLRAAAGMQRKTFIEVADASARGGFKRVLDSTAVSWGSSSIGWYADLLQPRERVNVNMIQGNNFIGVAGNIPKPTACDPGGTSVAYTIDIYGGTVVSTLYISALTAGLNLIVTNGIARVNALDLNGENNILDGGTKPLKAAKVKRTAWRELIQGR
jgi:type IV pilus assembly protein PilY1